MIGCLHTPVRKQPIKYKYNTNTNLNQSMRFILSLRLYSSFITSRPGLKSFTHGLCRHKYARETDHSEIKIRKQLTRLHLVNAKVQSPSISTRRGCISFVNAATNE